MKQIVRSLYGRISLLYLGLSLVLCLACAWVTVNQFRTFMGAVNQRLDRGLAASLVPRVERAATDTTLDRALRRVASHIRDLRPAAQLYLVETSGQVRASSVAPAYRKRDRIDTAPLQAFVDGATAPVWGEDPASLQDKKVFSATRMDRSSGPPAYLYVILNGCSADAIASTFQQTYVWRTFASSLLLVLGFTTIVGLALFWLLTRRFRALTDVVQRFKEGDYNERADAQHSDEIGQLGQAFNEMAGTIAAQVEALRRTDEERRRLVVQVSHDFRTPLTSIRGHAEQLLEAPRLASGDGAPAGTDAPSKPGPQARIETILQNADRLDHLSDRLHALSRMDVSGSELDVARFSLAELIHDMVVKFQPTAEEQNLTLQADLPADPPRARGDIGQVERLLSNLVENAMEHTPAGGDVAVRLRPKGAEMQVAVTDTGVGIPEEDIPLVTQRFYQVERASLNREKPEAGRSGEDISRPRSEGTGLGLAIAAQVARAHGGQLEIESTLGDGTTVSFTLPAAEE